MAYDPPGREIVLFGGETPYRHGFVRTEVRVAQWLADEEFPATRVADLDHLSQPFDVGGRLVTVWDLVRQATERATIADLGRILRALHRLAPRGRAGIAVAGRR